MMNYRLEKCNWKDPQIEKFLLEKHYLKRKPQNLYSFSIFDGDKLIGVITYSLPSCPICKKFNNQIIELSRLYLIDEAPKFSETHSIAKSISLLKQMKTKYRWIISFADNSVGHNGTIYQASNWIYTGKTKKMWDYKIKGFEKKHPRGVLNNKTVKEIKEIWGDKFYRKPRSIKSRYFYPLIKRKKALKELINLNYKVEKYEKKVEKEVK